MSDRTTDEQLAKSALEQGFPEHAKLYLLHGENDVVGQFLDWLNQDGIWLARYESGYNAELVPINESTRKLMARYFEIDEDKVEAEKQRMLDDIRAAQKAST